MEGTTEKRKAGLSRWAGGRFNTQGDLGKRLVLGVCGPVDPCSCLPAGELIERP